MEELLETGRVPLDQPREGLLGRQKGLGVGPALHLVLGVAHDPRLELLEDVALVEAVLDGPGEVLEDARADIRNQFFGKNDGRGLVQKELRVELDDLVHLRKDLVDGVGVLPLEREEAQGGLHQLALEGQFGAVVHQLFGLLAELVDQLGEESLYLLLVQLVREGRVDFLFYFK